MSDATSSGGKRFVTQAPAPVDEAIDPARGDDDGADAAGDEASDVGQPDEQVVVGTEEDNRRDVRHEVDPDTGQVAAEGLRDETAGRPRGRKPPPRH